jgi:ribosome-associated translation inhibitor RaiA
MEVLVSSASGGDPTDRVQGVIEGRLERFEGSITRVEVHLFDLNSGKFGERDKRCTIGAQVTGMGPIAVVHEASTLTEAIHVAADKLERAVEQALGRLEELAGPLPGSGISSSQ